jgi:hypothetical protein
LTKAVKYDINNGRNKGGSWMRKFFLLFAVVVLVGGCKRPEKTGVLFAWEPPRGMEPTLVTVQGYHVAPNGRMSAWNEMCVMHKASRRFSSDEYVCLVDIPSGSSLMWTIRYSSPGAHGGHCFSGDWSTDPPCGGNGEDVGRVRVIQGDESVSFEPVSNGIGPMPPRYFNYSAKLP